MERGHACPALKSARRSIWRSSVFATELERVVAPRTLLLFRALPDHAGKAFQGHQRLAGIGPLLQFLDRDVIERLAAGAAREQRARDVDHVRRAGTLVDERRAALRAEAAHGLCGLVFVARDQGLALGDTKTLAPASDIGRVGRTMRASACRGMIMPRPARRHVDLEGDLAAQALALGHSACCRWFRHVHPPSVVIARSESDEAIQSLLRGPGLLRGACHRAALRADPLARNDGFI